MEESIRIILEAVARSKGELDAALKQIEKLTGATKKQGTAFDQASRIVAQNRTALLAVGAAATAVAVSFIALIKRNIELGDTLNALSQKVGVSVETLSTLGEVAKQSNLEAGQFASGLKFLNKAIVESQTQGSEAAQAFEALGVSVKDGNGNFKTTEQVLFAAADAFRRYKDDATKTTVASKIFGRDGFSWIPLLNEGSAGLKANQDRIRALGGEMTAQFAKDADKFNDSLEDVKIVLRGAALLILKEILPSLIKLSEAVIRNKDVVVPAFIAISGAVAVAATAFTAFKTVTLLAAFVKLATLLPGLVTGLFGIGTATTAAGAAGATAAVALGPLLIAIVAISAALAIGVERWRAYKAAQEEAAANKALEDNTAAQGERLRRLSAELQKTGRITEEEADRINRALNKAGASGDIDLQLKANKAVIAAIKEKASAEEIFTAAAKAGATATAQQAASVPGAPPVGTEKPGLVFETPEAKKVRLQAPADLSGAEAEGANLKLENEQALQDARISKIQGAENQIAEIQKLSTEAAIADRIAQLDAFAATEFTSKEAQHQALQNIEATHENKLLEINKRGMDAKKALRQKELQNYSELFGGIAELSEAFGKKAFIAQKAAAIAQATVNTVIGVTAALGAGPYIGIALAAVVAALGAVQIAKIAGVSFAEGGIVPGTPSTKDNRLATVATGEYIFDARSVAKVGAARMAAMHAAIRDGSFLKHGFSGGGLVPRPLGGIPSFAAGGSVSAGILGRNPAFRNLVFQNQDAANFNIGFLDTRNRERDFARKEGARILIDQIKKRGGRVYP